MRTPINKESSEERVIERDRADVDFINDEFFLFTKKKIDGNFRTIGIIRCEEAYKLYFQDPIHGVGSFVYDFCFNDYLPLLYGSEAVEEGDIINIRTEIDLDFAPNLAEDDPIKPNPYIGNTYLVTFLKELDPL